MPVLAVVYTALGKLMPELTVYGLVRLTLL
jgi:hypothetical protein